MDDVLLRVAVRQGGCVSHDQARTAGLTDSSISRRLRAGRWQRVLPRTYRVTALRPDPAGCLWAAHLAVPGSAVGGLGALWRFGVRADPPGRAVLVLPSARRGLAGVRVVRSDLLAARSTMVRGMRVLRPAAALVQVLADGEPDGPELLDRAIQVGRVGLGELTECLGATVGCHGVRRARAVVLAAADGTASEAERLLVAALRAAGLAGFAVNHRVGRWIVDVAYPQARLAVEVDGFAFHSDPTRFAHDRRRQNALVLAGWTVVRFTWRDLDTDPGRVVAEVARALARATGEASIG